jgi:hypothetical protein
LIASLVSHGYSVPSGSFSAAPSEPPPPPSPRLPCRSASMSQDTSSDSSVNVKSGSCGTLSTTSSLPTSRIVSFGIVTLPRPDDCTRWSTVRPATVTMVPA